jgi:hypothetical protein
MIGGIRRDTDDTATDGALLAVNLRYWVEGEYRRRLGMERLTSIGANSAYSFWNPVNGQFALLVTSTGVLEAVAIV